MIAQRSLFCLAEVVFGITRERGAVERPVRRIEINEVSRIGIQPAEVALAHIHSLQSAMAGAQIRFIAYGRFLVAAHRHIELPLGIDAPKAVEAGLVEVDETRRYLDAVIEIVLTADMVVVVFRVIRRVLAQLGDEGLRIALDDLVGVDEIKIDIT